MRLRLMPVAAAVAALACTGCVAQAERQATADDLSRFSARSVEEWQHTKAAVDRFIHHHGITQPKGAVLDAGRFLEWRRREWWNLTDELAWHATYDRERIFALLDDSARFYGYEVRNAPRSVDDFLEFFRRADDEWRDLAMDITIFLEWKDRELMPLRRDLREFYAGAGREAANLQIDLAAFLRFREREYQRLIRDGQEWFAASLDEWDRMVDSIDRMQASAIASGRRIPVDLKNFWGDETEQVPRLVDDVWRFARWRQREWERLRRDLADAAAAVPADGQALVDDIRRHIEANRADAAQALLDLERFFTTYEREVGPLGDDIRAFWRSNIATGHLALQDAKRFFQAAGPEAIELRDGMTRFVAYGGVEWQRLTRRVKNFIDPDLPIGDPAVPRHVGPTPPPGQGNDPVPSDQHLTR
ncbi:MAG: hypothetical protein RLZZ127_2583 [Planctomycetota bacterium]|jgi:hypothetical protein